MHYKPLLSAQTVGVFVISPIRSVKLHKATFATGYLIFFGNTSDRGHYDRTAANNSPVLLGDLPCLLYIEFILIGIIKCECVLTNEITRRGSIEAFCSFGHMCFGLTSGNC